MTKTYRILVVDDEVDIEPLVLQRMRREIRKNVYEFCFAHNGVEALEMLNKDDKIDMVLSDINMPEMDGLTLLEQIPSVNPDIRSIIVSAYGDMKNIRTAMNRGAFDFVTKPIDFEDLRVTISRTIKHLQMWREALQARDQLISIQNELELACNMQQSILPREFPKTDTFEMYGVMEPARNVGGDFFDIIRLSDFEQGIAIADVSDKGVAAAMFMMSSRTLLKGAAVGAMDPISVLKEANDLLVAENDSAMFVTLCYAIYNVHTGRLHYSNGGHNAPLLVRADGSSSYLDMPSGYALGIIPNGQFSDSSIDLKVGDMVLFYTDGVTEAGNAKGEFFGEGRLADIGSKLAGTDAKTFSEEIVKAIHEFSGNAQQADDITSLVLKRKK